MLFGGSGATWRPRGRPRRSRALYFIALWGMLGHARGCAPHFSSSKLKSAFQFISTSVSISALTCGHRAQTSDTTNFQIQDQAQTISDELRSTDRAFAPFFCWLPSDSNSNLRFVVMKIKTSQPSKIIKVPPLVARRHDL